MASKDSKDVKSGTLLPKGVQPSAAPPLARSHRPKVLRQRIVEDYVSLDGDACDLSPPSSPSPGPFGHPSEPDAKSQSADQSAVAGPVTAQQCVAKLKSALDAESALLEARYFSAHRERYSPADHKHFYINAVQLAMAAGTEYTHFLNRISAGNGIDARLGTRIGNRHLRARISFHIQPTGQFTTVPLFPTVTAVLYRDKLPVTPNIAPPIYDTDTRPPTGAYNMFSRLGSTQSPQTDRCAVINPIAYDRYHIYKVHHMDSRQWAPADQLQMSTNSDSGTVSNTFHQLDMDVPLHDFETQFSNSAIAVTTENSLNLCLRLDWFRATDGLQINYHITTDLTFDDVQDDA